MAELCAALQVGARGYVEALASQVIIEQVAETVISGGISVARAVIIELSGGIIKATYHL